jgi:hypothetical protein
MGTGPLRHPGPYRPPPDRTGPGTPPVPRHPLPRAQRPPAPRRGRPPGGYRSRAARCTPCDPCRRPPPPRQGVRRPNPLQGEEHPGSRRRRRGRLLQVVKRQDAGPLFDVPLYRASAARRSAAIRAAPSSRQRAVNEEAKCNTPDHAGMRAPRRGDMWCTIWSKERPRCN